MNSLPRLYDLCFTLISNEIILEPSTPPGWDSWGVRDIAPLSDELGGWLKDSNQLKMFYSGSSKLSKGQVQQAGICSFDTSTRTCLRSSPNPFAASGQYSYSQNILTTPWVTRLSDDSYACLFRSAKCTGFEESIVSINLQSLDQPINVPSHPSIYAYQYAGLRQFPSLMGVLNCCKVGTKYMIFFEGYESQYEQMGQIFAAVTEDWITFLPFNNGFPIFTSRDVNSWPVKAVCNPRVISLENNWYALGFNGSYSGEYSIGLAFTQDFTNWIEHPQNPILVPRGWPKYDPMTGRLEGPCFDRNQILSSQNLIDMFYMAIPHGSLNHQNGVNGLCSFKVTHDKNLSDHFKYFPMNPQAIKVNESKTSLTLMTSKEKSKFLHAHRISSKPVKLINFGLKLSESNSSDASFYILFSNTLNSLPRGIGRIFRITNKGLYVLRGAQQFDLPAMPLLNLNTLMNALVGKLRSLIFKISSNSYAPSYGWQKLNSPCVFHQFACTIHRNDEESLAIYTVTINDTYRLDISSNYDDYRVVTFASFNNDAEVIDLDIQ